MGKYKLCQRVRFLKTKKTKKKNERK